MFECCDVVFDMCIVLVFWLVYEETSASSSSTAKFSPGQQAKLECQPLLPFPVKWKRFIVDIPGHFIDVVNGTQSSGNTTDRFSLENTTSNLLIDNVNELDSGLYVCVRFNDSGLHHFVKLDVQLHVGKFTSCYWSE